MADDCRIYGIIGRNIDYTLSPLIYNSLFRFHKERGYYKAFDLASTSLEEFIAAARLLGLAGFNVTTPFKSEIISHLQKLDSLAAATLSVNLVIDRKGSLVGYNTDYQGIAATIEDKLRYDVSGKNTAIIGSGGSARTAFYYLMRRGAARISVYHRSSQSARQFGAFVDQLSGHRIYQPIRYQGEITSIGDCALCINATPVLVKTLAPTLRPSAAGRVFELRYTGRQPRGRFAVGGAYMLAVQAAQNYRIMTGRKVAAARIIRIIEKARR